MSVRLHIQVHPGLSLKDPQGTELGRKILREGVLLIDELGLELFTFRKLAERIQSTEASVYRYFENKHLLFTYLFCWYWEWIDFQMEMQTQNIGDPRTRLRKTISILLNNSTNQRFENSVDIRALSHIVAAEGTKAYHTKAIDEEHAKGYFNSYTKFIDKVHDILLTINPDFPYPRALASNIIEMASNHLFFSEHMPGLTDVDLEENHLDKLFNMLVYFTFKMLSIEDV